VAVVLTLVQTKQIRTNIDTRNNIKKHSTKNTKHSKYKYTYCQNTHTLQNPLEIMRKIEETITGRDNNRMKAPGAIGPADIS